MEPGANSVHALIEQNKDAIFELCRRYHVKRLDVFGSAVGSDSIKESSDVDFVVEFARSEVIDRADQFFGLLFGLEDLFNRKIDLINLKSIRNRYFRENVEAARKLIYAS